MKTNRLLSVAVAVRVKIQESMIEQFERQELQNLISKARSIKIFVNNKEWLMAYENFIFACSILDAFIARSSVPECATSTQPVDLDKIGTPQCCEDDCRYGQLYETDKDAL